MCISIDIDICMLVRVFSTKIMINFADLIAALYRAEFVLDGFLDRKTLGRIKFFVRIHFWARNEFYDSADICIVNGAVC